MGDSPHTIARKVPKMNKHRLSRFLCGFVQPFNLCSTFKRKVERPQPVDTSGFVQPFNLDTPNPRTYARARADMSISHDNVERLNKGSDTNEISVFNLFTEVEQRLNGVRHCLEESLLCGYIGWADLTPGEQIRRWRLRAGLWRCHLASLLNISVVELERIESDENRPVNWPERALWLWRHLSPDLPAHALYAQFEAP